MREFMNEWVAKKEGNIQEHLGPVELGWLDQRRCERSPYESRPTRPSSFP